MEERLPNFFEHLNQAMENDRSPEISGPYIYSAKENAYGCSIADLYKGHDNVSRKQIQKMDDTKA